MRIIRVFPRRTSMTPTDKYAFVGAPPMIRPEADEVHVDCTFTWDTLPLKEKELPLAEYLRLAWSQYYPVVKLGGVAFDDPCNGFVPGQYVRQGVVFTSRGCNNQCPWCLAWRREGKLRELPIREGNVIQDNNLFQCPSPHIEKVFTMLKGQHNIQFSGGLDARLITDNIADSLRNLRIGQIFLACDTDSAIKPLEQAVKRLQMARQKIRCYVLVAYNGETISHAEERLRAVYEISCLPFAQLYQPPDKWIKYPKEWRDLARTWSRPAAIKALMRAQPPRIELQLGVDDGLET